ncbi:MAG: PAS domain S-box protein [Clostridia bacterium]|nr:PAS domain S-box protein [Clostridia bacterium]
MEEINLNEQKNKEASAFQKMIPVALDMMMTSTKDIVFIKDRSLKYVCLSQMFADLLGIKDLKEAVGKTDFDLFEPDLAIQYYTEDIRLMESNEPIIDHIDQLPMKDGIIRYSSMSKYLLKDNYGNIIGIYGTGRDITDNREALKRLQLLINTIPGGLATYELLPDGIRTLYLSEGVYSITGYEKDDYDLANNNPFAFVADEDKEELQSQIYMMIRNGTPLNIFIRVIRKDGTKRWVNVRGTEIERRNGRIMVNAVVFDVHEQRLAELKIKQIEYDTQKRYQYEIQLRKKLMRDSVFYYQVNLNSGVIEEYESQYGDRTYMKKGTKLSYHTMEQIKSEIFPEDLDYVSENLYLKGLRASYQSGKKEYSITYRRLLGDGEYHWVRMDVIMIEKPDEGEPIAFLACSDIDRKKKDQLSIGTLLNKDIESIFHINIKTGIAYIAHMVESVNYNKVYDQFIFEQESEAACKSVVLEEDRDYFINFYHIDNLVQRLEHDPITSVNYRVTEDGTIHWKYANAYYIDDRKDTIVLTRRDVTKAFVEERQQNEALQAAVALANDANQAKSAFLSRMSHDIRTPLNAILAFSNKELLEGADQDKLREYLEKVNMSGDYLLGIINDVLDMSRIEQKCIKLNPEPYYLTDFEKTMHNVIDELSKNRNITFSMDISQAGMDGILVDHVRFNQIFVNLLSNAVKFTQIGGKVELIITELASKKNQKEIKRFIVKDNGIGMSREFIPHAFDSFNQEYRKDTSERNQGTGLGLSIVKELVTMMGGTIDLQSELNKGTVFTIDLPVEKVKAKKQTPILKVHDYSILNGTKILLGEDNDINTEIAKVLLQKYGVEVERAINGKEACQMFSESQIGYYQLILMDIRMPIMDGITATKIIREMDRADAKSVPIIAMTADAFSEDARVAFDAGMNAHLAKPIDPSKLYHTCCMYLGKDDLPIKRDL